MSRTKWNVLVTLAMIVTAAMVMVAGMRAGAPDIEGRAQASLALRSTVILYETYGADGPYCSGIIVGAGEVLTAYHCVARIVDSERAVFVAEYERPAQKWAAYIKRTWVGYDLAVLRVPAGLTGRPAQVAPDVSAGEALYLAGAPDAEPFVVTSGRVARVVTDRFTNCPRNVTVGALQHQIVYVDALTFHGNSGGGAFNQDGQVIGVLVRLHYTGDLGCPPSQLRDIGFPLWGYAVGPDTIRRALQ